MQANTQIFKRLPSLTGRYRFMFPPLPVVRLKRAWDRLDIIYEETESLFKRSVASREICELRNMVNVGYLIMRQAMERKESRGLHYTIDYPHVKK